MIQLLKIFFKDPKYRKIAIISVFAVSVLALSQVYMSYLFLGWYGTFYNALQTLDLVQFWSSMYSFCILAGICVVLDTCSKYLNQRVCFIWRKCLTENLLLIRQKKRQRIEGEGQRIQEDTQRFTRIVEGLYVGCLKAISSLIVFTPALWALSALIFPKVPGVLPFLALFYSIGGIILSWYIGRKLPQLEFNNQVQEAALRTAIERDDDKNISYSRYIENVRTSYYELYWGYFKFNLWGNSFFQASVVFPYIICGSALFAKLITLGTLVQISKAFDNVQSSLAYLIEKWTDITELRSVVLRLNAFISLDQDK